MKNKKKFLLLIIPIIIIIILIDQYNIKHPKENAFSIYLVKNLDLSKEQKTPIRLEDLELEKEPFMEISDIERFYWNDTNVNGFIIDAHSFKLKKALVFKPSENYHIWNIPFILVVNGKRLCLGSFVNPQSSLGYSNFVDIAISQVDNPPNIYSIKVIYAKNKNILNDERIYKILRKYHKL